jgi:short-subunit dehydrogenase
MRLRGSVVLVTGASSGIGAELARAAASRGGELILVARGREKLETLAAELRSAGSEVDVRPADLADFSEVEALAAELIDSGRVPDVIVNNAGAGRWRAADENEPGESERQMSLPYLAAFELTRALLAPMIERGSGQIVNMTSAAAYFYFPGANGYGTARHAMRAFSEHLREDLRGTGIEVTLIVPAEVDSPYFDNNPGSRERIPRIGRVLGTASPAAVAERAIAAAERGRRVVHIPRRIAVFEFSARHFPRSTRALVTRTGWRRPAPGGG